VHAALAEATDARSDPGRRAWHRAEAGPVDEFASARVDSLRGRIAFSSGLGSDAPPLLLKAAGEGHGAFIEALKKSGELITTQALVEPSRAAVVSVPNGQPVVTDGPFLESKQYLGG